MAGSDAFRADPGALSVLVVCTGNICRSPMAEAAFRSFLAASGERIAVRSRGLAAVPEAAIHPLAVKVCRDRQIEIDADRRAVRLIYPDIQAADLVLVMERGQRQTLLRHHPTASGKVHLLGHWQGIEIEDPMGGTRAQFEKCLDAICTAAASWLASMRKAGMTRESTTGAAGT